MPSFEVGKYMRILLINKFLYSKGGDAVCTLSMGDLLRSKGHEVVFWGMEHSCNPDYPYKELFVSRIDFNNLCGSYKQVKAALNMLYSFEAKNKMGELLKQFKPDIVHLHNFAHQISPSVLHILKRHRIPIVTTMHDYKMICASYILLNNGKVCELCRNGKYYNCFLQGCVKSSRAKSLLNTIEMYLHHNILHIYDLINVFISPSMFLKNKLEEMGFKGKIVYIPNFVDVLEYEPKYGWEEKIIVYFGRLSQGKGIRTLIEAVKRLDVKLKIIGDGPIREELERMVKGESISNVEFLGYKTGDDLKNEIKKSMFVVVPSEWYENNPISILEAFALGKPVIGAEIGGIPEIIQDNITGLFFAAGNVNDLRDRIKLLLEEAHKIELMGRSARVFVEEKFNSNLFYNKLIKIYESILGEQHNVSVLQGRR